MGALAFILATCGFVLTAIAVWRSYTSARHALAPLAHQGDPTRAALEALRPLPFRPKVRTAVSRVLLAVGWLAVALYGLYFVVRAGTISG
jgi:hypothetical protein